MKFIELFAGIGGFRYGLERCNKDVRLEAVREVETTSDTPDSNEFRNRGSEAFTCVWANEIDKYACQVYRKNYGEGELYEGDITTVDTKDIPDHGLLVGGFPCQAFSIAGKRGGFDDTRGTLFFEIARILKSKQPMFLLLENVKGLISHDKGNTLKIILESLQNLGYYVNYEVYNSKFYGVPQNRERVFFLCKHIKGFVDDGLQLKTSFSKEIIKEYLFQLLLSNLSEVKKLQEIASKDWVVGYLVLKEIIKNGAIAKLEPLKKIYSFLQKSCKKNYQLELWQQSQTSDTLLEEDNIKAGILTAMEENKSELQTEELWRSIGILSSNILDEDWTKRNTSTILTLIKQTIESKTYTFAKMFETIVCATVLLRNMSKSCWSEILLDLIVIKEDTKYARINDKTEEGIIRTEYNNLHITSYLQDFRECFIIGHLRGQSGRQVFPIGGDDKETINGIKKIIEGSDFNSSQALSVYSKEGLSTTLAANGGGNGAKTGLYAIPVLTPDREEKRQNGRRFKTDGEPAFTQTAQDRRGVYDGCRIRRLTPTECERLQGFPDGRTEGGLTPNGNCVTISDTQRYKTLGNAVSTPVITAIGRKL